MNSLLRKLKLVDNLTTDLEISKHEFVTRLQGVVDKGSVGTFSDFFDVFDSSKNEYKGYVGLDRFEIKKRRRFFDSSLHLAVAKGTYHQKDQTLIINTEIIGFTNATLPIFILLIFFYLIFIVTFSLSDAKNLSFLPFILLHALFMFSIPYFIMRKSTRRLKHDLEREFYFLTKNKRSAD